MALTNTRKVQLGGGLSLIVADFTATVGAADQTLAVAGRVLAAWVNPGVTAEPVDYRSLFSQSVSGNITTLTLYTEAAITAGTVVVLVDQGG